jgi:peroxiredoxin Q/BCP
VVETGRPGGRFVFGKMQRDGGAVMAQVTIEVGKKAPAFSLADQNGRRVSLEDFAGSWVVLYFYPKDDTPGCTTEACEFTDSVKAFEGLDAVVLGCSPDSPASHLKFIAKHSLALRLLSDPGHEAMERYGAWGEKTMYGKKTVGVKRSTVLIDPKGTIAFHWPNVKAAGHAEAVKEKLAELQSR